MFFIYVFYLCSLFMFFALILRSFFIFEVSQLKVCIIKVLGGAARSSAPGAGTGACTCTGAVSAGAVMAAA